MATGSSDLKLLQSLDIWAALMSHASQSDPRCRVDIAACKFRHLLQFRLHYRSNSGVTPFPPEHNCVSLA
jgi:hypothetical protein